MSKVEINRERCKGCEYCIFVCPKDVLGLAESINKCGARPAVVINPDSCNGCTLCAIMCPEICIDVWK